VNAMVFRIDGGLNRPNPALAVPRAASFRPLFATILLIVSVGWNRRKCNTEPHWKVLVLVTLEAKAAARPTINYR
jgi:hypothetical protein